MGAAQSVSNKGLVRHFSQSVQCTASGSLCYSPGSSHGKPTNTQSGVGKLSETRRHMTTTSSSSSIHPSSTTNSTPSANGSTFSASSKEPIIHPVWEAGTSTWQYIVSDPSSSAAAIIDPVLDYDPLTQTISTKAADALLDQVISHKYEITYLLETHAHADHLSASSYLQARLHEIQGYRPPIGIGKRIGAVQELFSRRYGVPKEETTGVFDKLFDDDEEFTIGNLKATAIHLPGHTPDHLGYRIGDNVFCGDSLFNPDVGTARCDFPGGSADNLFDSGKKLLNMAPHVKIWTGHDYPPQERPDSIPAMTVQEHRESNKHLRDGIGRDEFVAMRQQRDSSLGAPRLLHQSLQVNIRAGKLPRPNEAGLRLLHLPLRLGDLKW